MNLSGIRTDAAFYDYNSIKINEIRNHQIQNVKEEEQRTDSQILQRQQEDSDSEPWEYRRHEDGTKEFTDRYQPDAVYELKGADSDITKLDVEQALSDLKKDYALQQYQYFADTDSAVLDEALNQKRQEEKFWL